MSRRATGRLGRVVYAHLSPGDDVFTEILEIAREEKIHTGLVLDITGGVSQVRMITPPNGALAHSPPEVIEMHGLGEVMGSGIIGHAERDFVSRDGHVRHEKGSPYLHIHLTAAANGETVTGHLIEGTLVRSVIPQSHFTIALAEVEGVELSMMLDETPSQDYPSGVLYHALRSVSTTRL